MTELLDGPIRPGKRVRIGELLVSKGFVTADQVTEALRCQKRTGMRLGQTLLQMRVLSERDVTETLSQQLDLAFSDLGGVVIDRALPKLVPAHIARRHQMIPIHRVGNRLTLAMQDPLNILAIDDVQLMSGLQVTVVIATPTDVARALKYTYGDA